MENVYNIVGGKPLSGTVTLSGAKNVSLKTIIAALLFESPVTLERVPRIKDVEELIHLITLLGVNCEFIEKNTLRIDASGLKHNNVDLLHASKIRVAFLLFAPLLARFGECYIPNPGGCRLGERSIDRIVEGMKALGATVDYDSTSGYYHAVLSKSVSGTYRFAKPTHTGTELLILMGILGDGEVTIENASLEPEIDELIQMLSESGATLMRTGENIHVNGVKSLKQEKPFMIGSDRNEAVTYATLGLATGGTITIKSIHPSRLESFIDAVKKTGCTVEVDSEEITFSRGSELNAIDITTAPHPGFMTDWQPNWAILMTQATGTATIHEMVFENRFAYVEELRKLGAHIEYIDLEVAEPEKAYHFNWTAEHQSKQAIKIWGKEELHGAALKMLDLRAGASLLVAALVAHGESVVQGASTLERGYEDVVEKITALGGTIKKV
jgi:UDP-N-acetylglucosamine 1-carboxyvinyltransferase